MIKIWVGEDKYSRLHDIAVHVENRTGIETGRIKED
jgi:hypothetical protein